MAAELPKNKRARYWSFTHQVPDSGLTDTQFTKVMREMEPEPLFVRFQREVAPTTGQEHFQGFIAFAKPKSWTQVRKVVSWAEPTRNLAAWSRYCGKQKTRMQGHETIEIGEMPEKHQGKRNDLEKIIRAVEVNPYVTWSELAMTAPSVKNVVHFVKALKAEKQPKRKLEQAPEVIWLYGQPGMRKQPSRRLGHAKSGGENTEWCQVH